MSFEGKLPEKLTRTILQYSNLCIKIHVKLKNEYGFCHNEFSYGDKTYVNLTFNGYLTLEMVKDKNNVYDPSKSFIVGIGNIGNVIKKMKKVLNSIYTEDMFVIKNKKIIIYEDISVKCTEKIVIPRISQALLIKPAVVYDENETSYEGVNFYINNSTNIVSLSIDEFENLVYVLDKIDLVNASQLLLNYYMSYLSNEDKIKKIENKPVKHIPGTIDWGSSNKNKTISNYRKEEETNIFDGL